MSDKVFIISGLNESKSLTELKSVIIVDTIGEKKSLYLFDSNESQFYECVKQTNTLRSFLVNNSVISDGDLYVCTRFDPLFIILPFLMNKRKHFHSLFEILTDIFDKEMSHKLEKSLNSQSIGSIADLKFVNDEPYVRYNSNRALDWLKCKTENTIDALIKNNVNVWSDGCKVSGYSTGREDQTRDRAEYTKIAFEMISQYLNDEISAELKNQLRLPQDLSDSSVSMASKTQIKRKMNENESSAPLEDYSAYNSGPNTSAIDNQRSKMSRTQRELLRVDKTGMKSISTFFKPKPKQK